MDRYKTMGYERVIPTSNAVKLRLKGYYPGGNLKEKIALFLKGEFILQSGIVLFDLS